MICNLKALWLVLLGLVALGAWAAPAVHAQQGFLTSDGPVTLFGEETGEASANAWTMFNAKIQCPGSVYTGHKVGTTSQLPSGSTAATITPHYKQANCRVHSPERRATVAMNGCDYVFRLGATVAANTYAVTADIACPNATEGIHVSVYELGDPTHTGVKICTVEITPQTGLTGAHVSTDTAADLLNVVGTFHGIHAERTGVCKFDTFGETTTTAEWHVDLTITGLNSAGAPTGVTVTD